MKERFLQRPYPTDGRNFPVSPYELSLIASRIERDRDRKKNNHHLEFTARQFGRLGITQTLRDLSGMQVVIPVNAHTLIHQLYCPPVMPRLDDAMERIEMGMLLGEKLKIFDDQQRLYVEHDIDGEKWRQLQEEYTHLTDVNDKRVVRL